jgi:nicotinamide riboside kinase
LNRTKTTLAIQLADHYKTAWVPEFARDYLQEKWDKSQLICDVNDMLPIAYGQTKFENYSLSIANKYLFCDKLISNQGFQRYITITVIRY